MKTASLAVMGGTFDPIHYGHLVAAEAVRETMEMDRILFIPSGQPPHKRGRHVSSAEDRYQMTQLATKSNPFFEASRLEIDRGGNTYTVDTMTQLKEQYPDTKLWFITGADAFQEILSWKTPERLMELCHFVVVTRPGYEEALSGDEALSAFIQAHRERICFLTVPAMEISSSDLRERIHTGRTIRYFLPAEVEAYIYAHGLYEEVSYPRDAILADLHAHLSEERFQHTLGVEEAARRLAAYYKQPVEEAAIAALLHDNAKYLPVENLVDLCRRAYPPSMELTADHQPILHAFAGAERARQQYPWLSSAILDAIRYHTTGRPAMTPLEKIIFIADYIEPGRPNRPEFQQARALAFEDLDTCVRCILQQTVAYLQKRGGLIYPLTLEAEHYYNTL